MKVKDLLELYAKPIILNLILLFFILTIDDKDIFYCKYSLKLSKEFIPQFRPFFILFISALILFIKNGTYYTRYKDGQQKKQKFLYAYIFNINIENKGPNEIKFTSTVVFILYIILNITLVVAIWYKAAKIHSFVKIIVITLILILSLEKIFKMFLKRDKTILLSIVILFFSVIIFYESTVSQGKIEKLSLNLAEDTLSNKNNKLKIKGRNFNGINLYKATIKYASIENCRFKNANLTNSDFSNSKFRGYIDFTNSIIDNINIYNCNLKAVKGLNLEQLINIPTKNREKVSYPKYILDSIKIKIKHKNYRYCSLLYTHNDSIYCECIKNINQTK